MKRLLLLRHAKSDWNMAGQADFDRTLAPRGQHAAPVIGKYISDQGLAPDLVLCSPAVRAQQTWALAAEMLDRIPPVELVPALYNASPHDIVQEVRVQGRDAGTICIVGHHPGIDGTALFLAGTGDQGALDRIRAKYPTGALAVLESSIEDWAALAPGIAELKRFVTPGELD
jgi:phosphohistidine phosphatase